MMYSKGNLLDFQNAEQASVSEVFLVGYWYCESLMKIQSKNLNNVLRIVERIHSSLKKATSPKCQSCVLTIGSSLFCLSG